MAEASIRICLTALFLLSSSLQGFSQAPSFPKPSNEGHKLSILAKEYLDKFGENAISCKAKFTTEGRLRFVEISGEPWDGELQFAPRDGLRIELACSIGEYSLLTSGSKNHVVSKWIPNEHAKRGTSQSIPSAMIGRQTSLMIGKYWPAWLDFIVNTKAYLYFDPVTMDDGIARCDIRSAGSDATIEVVFRETPQGIEVLSISTRVPDQLVASSNFENALIGDLWFPLSSNATQEGVGYQGKGRIDFSDHHFGAPELNWLVEFEEGVTVTDQINNVTYKVEVKP
jgi:hypothetical protein